MKLFKNFLYLLSMLGCLSLITGLAAADQNRDSDTFTEKNQLIFKKINLDKDQATKIRQLLNGYRTQGQKDRQEFSKNVSVLIDKARDRRKKLETEIESQLWADQRETFKSIFSLDPLENELFTLQQGLILDTVQTNTVEYILMKLQEEYRRKIPQQGVRGTGRPDSGRMARKNWDSRKRRYLSSILKQREAKKAREIKKILTKDQKKRYKEIQKIRKKQINEMLENMKTRSSPPPF